MIIGRVLWIYSCIITGYFHDHKICSLIIVHVQTPIFVKHYISHDVEVNACILYYILHMWMHMSTYWVIHWSLDQKTIKRSIDHSPTEFDSVSNTSFTWTVTKRYLLQQSHFLISNRCGASRCGSTIIIDQTWSDHTLYPRYVNLSFELACYRAYNDHVLDANVHINSNSAYTSQWIASAPTSKYDVQIKNQSKTN